MTLNETKTKKTNKHMTRQLNINEKKPKQQNITIAFAVIHFSVANELFQFIRETKTSKRQRKKTS